MAVGDAGVKHHGVVVVGVGFPTEGALVVVLVVGDVGVGEVDVALEADEVVALGEDSEFGFFEADPTGAWIVITSLNADYRLLNLATQWCARPPLPVLGDEGLVVGRVGPGGKPMVTESDVDEVLPDDPFPVVVEDVHDDGHFLGRVGDSPPCPRLCLECCCLGRHGCSPACFGSVHKKLWKGLGLGLADLPWSRP